MDLDYCNALVHNSQPTPSRVVPKPFITPQEQDFITELSVKVPKLSSYLNDDTSFWENLDDECNYNQ